MLMFVILFMNTIKTGIFMFISLIIFIVCTISGVLTGLLGIGGGLVIVPMFMTVLPFLGIDLLTTHQIVAVSTTCVFFNSATTAFYRRKEQFIDKKLLILLSVFIILGTVSGSYISSFAPDKLIFIVYFFVCLLSLYLFNKTVFFDLQNSKFKYLIYLIFTLIGALSSIIGIGGAVFFATALRCFVESDTKKLLPSITFLVFVHASFAFFSKLALGEVIYFIIPTAIIASLIGSKIGTIISRHVSTKVINIMMQAVLIFGLIRISVEFFKT